MLIKSRGLQDHSRRVDALVQHWLHDRKALKALMAALDDELRRDLDVAVLSTQVQGLCEALMDYLSAGHFEIYDELLAEAEQRGSQNLATGLALYPQLQATTDEALRFNDRYEAPIDAAMVASLPMELAELLPVLEKRFGIEDRMIALLHEHVVVATD